MKSPFLFYKKQEGAVKKRNRFFTAPFLGDRKNCLKVSNRAVGLPDGVHRYAEWRGLEVAKGVLNRKNIAFCVIFSSFFVFQRKGFVEKPLFLLPFAVRTIFTSPC